MEDFFSESTFLAPADHRIVAYRLKREQAVSYRLQQVQRFCPVVALTADADGGIVAYRGRCQQAVTHQPQQVKSFYSVLSLLAYADSSIVICPALAHGEQAVGCTVPNLTWSTRAAGHLPQ